MQQLHLYILQSYNGINSRYRCPACNSNTKTFSRYINTQTGEQISNHVGRCSRECKCVYHYTPKQYFQDNNISIPTIQQQTFKQLAPKAKIIAIHPTSFIKVSTFKQSLKAYEGNNFVQYLLQLFGSAVTLKLISIYFIGSSNHWKGATVFWQIDKHGKIRTGKIMLYNIVSGKRVKEPFNHITWVHKLTNQSNYQLSQCFFGEHLLNNNTKPIAIVESEKTVIIASIYLPQFTWLASGSLNNLTPQKCSILKGHPITLFPDLNVYEKWVIKAKELAHITKFTVSNLLETKATQQEKELGLDLADYLVRFNYLDFISPIQSIKLQNVTKSYNNQQPEQNHENSILDNNLLPIQPLSATNLPKTKSINWSQDIVALSSFFQSQSLPSHPIVLNQCTTITNVGTFVHSHLNTLQANNGNKTFHPFLQRLKALQAKIITLQNP